MEKQGRTIISIIVVVLIAYMMMGLVGLLPNDYDIARRFTAVDTTITEYDISPYQPLGFVIEGDVLHTASGGAIISFDPNVFPNIYPITSGAVNIIQDSTGVLWFTEPNYHAIGELNLSTSTVTEHVVGATEQPYDLAVDGYGNIWFTDTWTSNVGMYNVSDHSFDTYGISSRSFGIAVDGNNSIWFAETNANKIGMITHEGDLTEYTIPKPNSLPQELLLDDSGNFWIGLDNIDEIARLAFSGSTPVYDYYPLETTPDTIRGFSMDVYDRLWFGKADSNQISRLDLSKTDDSYTFVDYEIPTDMAFPFDTGIDASNRIWFSEYGTFQIGVMDIPAPTSENNPSPEDEIQITLVKVGDWTTGSSAKFVQGTGQSIIIKAEVESHSDYTISDVVLRYKGIGNSTFDAQAMLLVDGDESTGTWYGLIPPQSSAGTVLFTIGATNSNDDTVNSIDYALSIQSAMPEITQPSSYANLIYGVSIIMLTIVGIAVNRQSINEWRRGK